MFLIRIGPLRTTRSIATFAHQLQKHDEFTQKVEETAKMNESRQKMADEDEFLRAQVLDASLKFVPDHGWTKEAIEKAVDSMGFPKVTAGLVANGPIDLVHHHYEKSNLLIEKVMTDDPIANYKGQPAFLRKHVENRLKMNIPYLHHWSQALGMMALPQNAPKSLHLGLTLVDSFWFHAGDKSTDYNWYTKRLLLMGIYKSTELAMMQDSSAGDFKATWDFLDRRFDDVRDLSGIVKGGPEDVGKVLNSLGTTLKVLVGLPR